MRDPTVCPCCGRTSGVRDITPSPAYLVRFFCVLCGSWWRVSELYNGNHVDRQGSQVHVA